MNEITQDRTTKPNRFVLTRRNQKGQVAIFVALIFQVVFVFFALLINVGLLVHQKINLQQSVDLAAYYGAGKQAEVLNAIAHVNFQIKQTWKLMTWRYRILGTFGFQKDRDRPPSQAFPFENDGSNFAFNGRNADLPKCATPTGVQGTQDIPFFCIGHSGFTDWVASTETTCRIGCDGFTSAYTIRTIPNASGITVPLGGNVAGSINTAIDNVNLLTQRLCEKLGPTSATVFSRFISAYSSETLLRTRLLEMLAKNLSKEADKELDLDGEPIFKGVKTTLINNLTEANKTGFLDAKLAVDNGLSKCPFDKGSKKTGGREFLKKIEFDFVNY
ncbi:MAG: pilus assembly protein TadG-related protein, partial [Pseudobdellovibrio sp.]